MAAYRGTPLLDDIVQPSETRPRTAAGYTQGTVALYNSAGVVLPSQARYHGDAICIFVSVSSDEQRMANYAESATRHFRDADFLKADRRHGNADQLYGLAAECAFKAVMVGLGAPTSPESDLANRQHRVHVNDLWAEFQSFVHTTTSVAYLAKLPADNPFVDWSIEQRYAADGEVLERAVQCHHAGALRVLKLLEQAKVDGVVW